MIDDKKTTPKKRFKDVPVMLGEWETTLLLSIISKVLIDYWLHLQFSITFILDVLT